MSLMDASKPNSNPQSPADKFAQQHRAGEEKRKSELLEALAELEHEQWRSWALAILDTEEISETRKERWKETCFKSYDQLTEEQKDQDRVYAEKVLWLLKKHLGIR